jgi:hypothetical protein
VDYITNIASCRRLHDFLRSTTLNLRIDPSIKDALREAARRENRSIANMIEVLIRRHCEDVGIRLPKKPMP